MVRESESRIKKEDPKGRVLGHIQIEVELSLSLTLYLRQDVSCVFELVLR